MTFLSKLKRVLAAHHIADHIEDFTSLTLQNDRLTGHCPICRQDRTKSLMVFPDLRFFYCLECDAAGDVIGFIQRMHGVELVEAVELLDRQSATERQGPTRGTRHDVTLSERERRDIAWGLIKADQSEVVVRPNWPVEDWDV